VNSGKRSRLTVLLAVATALLAGCGYRGSLERPGGKPSEPAQAESTPAPAPTAPADRNTPKKPFVLDGLIR
jgi:uncharacterized lipoprotein